MASPAVLIFRMRGQPVDSRAKHESNKQRLIKVTLHERLMARLLRVFYETIESTAYLTTEYPSSPRYDAFQHRRSHDREPYLFRDHKHPQALQGKISSLAYHTTKSRLLQSYPLEAWIHLKYYAMLSQSTNRQGNPNRREC